MSKDSLQIKEINGKTLGFSEFWLAIASEIGDSRLKINAEAESIKTFLDAASDHRDFLRTLIHQSYKRCRCYHLKARFDVNIALDILGETSFNLQGTKEDDLLDIELLEEVAWLINQRFAKWIEMPESMLPSNYRLSNSCAQNRSEKEPLKPSLVVSMSNLKIRKANRRL